MCDTIIIGTFCYFKICHFVTIQTKPLDIKLRGNDNDLKKYCLNKATEPKNKFRYDFRE